MKHIIEAHPEAMLHSICDVMAPIEAAKQRCSDIVMSSMAFTYLLKEDPERVNVEMASLQKMEEAHNLIGFIWGACIYIDREEKYLKMTGYGENDPEKYVDYPNIFQPKLC
jgi:hypothetical protein